MLDIYASRPANVSQYLCTWVWVTIESAKCDGAAINYPWEDELAGFPSACAACRKLSVMCDGLDARHSGNMCN